MISMGMMPCYRAVLRLEEPVCTKHGHARGMVRMIQGMPNDRPQYMRLSGSFTTCMNMVIPRKFRRHCSIVQSLLHILFLRDIAMESTLCAVMEVL